VAPTHRSEIPTIPDSAVKYVRDLSSRFRDPDSSPQPRGPRVAAGQQEKRHAGHRNHGLHRRPEKVIKLYRVLSVMTAVAMISGAVAAAAELPTFGILDYPLTQHQLTVINSLPVQELPPTPTLTLNGMPASPVQIMILTPRPGA
jgi:hypothetical protein